MVLNQQLVFEALLLVELQLGLELHYCSLQGIVAWAVDLHPLELLPLGEEQTVVLLDGLCKLLVVRCLNGFLLAELFPQSCIFLFDLEVVPVGFGCFRLAPDSSGAPN